MLAKDYPASAFRSQPEVRFHQLARKYGLIEDDLLPDVSGSKIDDSHTYIRVDMSRCINCFACVRICDEVQGQFVWQVAGRGEKTYIVPDSYGPFGDSTCVSCGGRARTRVQQVRFKTSPSQRFANNLDQNHLSILWDRL